MSNEKNLSGLTVPFKVHLLSTGTNETVEVNLPVEEVNPKNPGNNLFKVMDAYMNTRDRKTQRSLRAGDFVEHGNQVYFIDIQGFKASSGYTLGTVQMAATQCKINERPLWKELHVMTDGGRTREEKYLIETIY